MMEKQTVEERFNTIKEHFEHGDAVKISEIAGKRNQTRCADICRKIIAGDRNPQLWFVDVAEDYLRVLGRI